MKKPEMSLHNKVALITGAAGGIGKAIALAFGAAGARVFLSGTSVEKLTDLAAALKAEGVETAYKAIDVRAASASHELVDAVVQTMGTVDILVNSAGINRPQKSVDVTEENWDAVLDTNLKAAFFLSQAAGKEMIKKNGGKDHPYLLSGRPDRLTSSSCLLFEQGRREPVDPNVGLGMGPAQYSRKRRCPHFCAHSVHQGDV